MINLSESICPYPRGIKKYRAKRRPYYQRWEQCKEPMVFVFKYRGCYRVEIDTDSAYPAHFTLAEMEELRQLAHEHWDAAKLKEDALLFCGGTHYAYFANLSEDMAFKVATKALELWRCHAISCVTEMVQ